jgi:DNA-directed RNA polymerase specialized sigma24 family protein
MPERAPPAKLSVGELVRQLSAAGPGHGSEQVQELIHRFEPVLRTAWRHGGFELEYEDYVQEVFLNLFGALPGSREPEAFPGFFRRIALSTAAGLARAQRALKRSVSETGQELGEVQCERPRCAHCGV